MADVFDVFRTIVIMSLTGGALALLLLLIKPLIRDRLPKRAQYVLWIVVVAALLLPVSKIVILPETATTQPIPTIAETVERYVPTQQQLMERVKTAEMSGSPDDAEVPSVFWQELVDVLPTVWFFGMLLALCAFLFPYILLLGRLSGNRTPATLTASIPAYFSPLAATPMLIGAFCPAIYLPEREYSDEQLQNVLAHELTHLRRKDIWIKWLSVIAVSLHWFNPLAWLMRREIDRLCELSCDETVIAKYGIDEKQSYGDTLIAVVAERKLPATVLSTTMGESKKALKERLGAIMKHHKHSKLIIALSCALIVAAVGTAVVLGAGSKANEPKTHVFDYGDTLVRVDLPNGFELADPTPTGNFYAEEGEPERLQTITEFVIDPTKCQQHFITDTGGNAVGAVTFVSIDGVQEFIDSGKNPRALYQGLMLGSGYRWGDNYTVLDENDNFGVATTNVSYADNYINYDELPVSHKAQLKWDDENGCYYDYGILAYELEHKCYVAVELNCDSVSDKQVSEMAKSLKFIFGEPETPLTSTMSELRTPYVGVGSAVAKIVGALPPLGYRHRQKFFSIGDDYGTGKAPCTLTVYYEQDGKINDEYAITPRNAVLLFALIDNLEEVSIAVCDAPSGDTLDKSAYHSRVTYEREELGKYIAEVGLVWDSFHEDWNGSVEKAFALIGTGELEPHPEILVYESNSSNSEFNPFLNYGSKDNWPAGPPTEVRDGWIVLNGETTIAVESPAGTVKIDIMYAETGTEQTGVRIGGSVFTEPLSEPQASFAEFQVAYLYPKGFIGHIWAVTTDSEGNEHHSETLNVLYE